jgi:hypothetical protein
LNPLNISWKEIQWDKARRDPNFFAEQYLGFIPDPWQTEVLRTDSKRVLLNCSRQSGKSTITAAMALHTAIFKLSSLILVISPSLRQSLELFRKLTDNLDKLDPEPALIEDNKLSCQFENGSRVVALPGHETTIRGFSAPSLVIEDEASRCEDEIYSAIRPMLAVSKGRLILLSTPHGKRGHFFEAWQNGGPEWFRIRITADQCPRITADFLQEERRALGDRLYRQEYFGEFVETVDQLFHYDEVVKAISPDVKALDLGIRKPW